MAETSRYILRIGLQVLNHLGLNLYSNVPAVLSEAIANAWDADAGGVSIGITKAGGDDATVEIVDDGEGMNLEDINERFLYVGYQRRTDPAQRRVTKSGRIVMGRKGIGKLSLFSISSLIEVHTKKGRQKHSFCLDLIEIRKAMKGDNASYLPPTIAYAGPDANGTRILLRNVNKRITAASTAHLRRRLARRFSVAPSGKKKFSIFLDGKRIIPEDRAYYDKIQYIWGYGKRGKSYIRLCKNAKHSELRSGALGGGFEVEGWIGTVTSASSLSHDEQESLNQIVLMVRDKQQQEDILDEVGERGIYASYVIGELHADFLDLDDRDDIATSSRQSFIKDDERYLVLREFVRKELKYIEGRWSNLRNEEGTAKAVALLPAIKEWIDTLPKGAKQSAKMMLGKMNTVRVDDEEQRKSLIKHSIIAFENIRIRDNLLSLGDLTGSDLAAVGKVLESSSEFEGVLYYEIISERLKVIDGLVQHVSENDLEKIIQSYIGENLWLLDPSWERAGELPEIEKRLGKYVKNEAGLTKAEKDARLDIKYRRAVGHHVVIELKRPEVKVKTGALIDQINKYRVGIQKSLASFGRTGESVEIVCLLGSVPLGWETARDRADGENQLRLIDARVLLYEQLIDDAQAAYRAFLTRSKEIGQLRRLLDAIRAG